MKVGNTNLIPGIIHFVGIGGIGMSGIAEIMHAMKYNIQGSDISENKNVKRLQGKGIKVFIGHKKNNVKGVSSLVVSSAIIDGNAELEEAKKNNIPIISRAKMLSELMNIKSPIVISGSHGKTTTTSLIGSILEYANYDPTIINGGIINAYGTNTRMGNGKWIVVEADESDGTFCELPSIFSIVTNVDQEHLDYYKNNKKLEEAFKFFINKVPFYGAAIVCNDDPKVKKIISEIDNKHIITYGFTDGSDLQATSMRYDGDFINFDIKISIKNYEKRILNNIKIPLAGKHNVLNALAAIVVACKLNIDVSNIISALKNFKGIERRLTKVGKWNEILIIDDYAHHPTEIKSTLEALKDSLKPNRIIAIFQPHRYSRVKDLFEEFLDSFEMADYVVVSDIYAAGENPIDGISKSTIVKKLNEKKKNAIELDNPDLLGSVLKKFLKKNDVVIFLGAGTSTNWAHSLKNKLETS